MPRWIYLLIQHYTVYPSSDFLLYHICNQSEILISTGESRTHNKSGGSWIIALQNGTKPVSGHNTKFGRHIDINSYHSEIYASLAFLIFLEYYCDNFFIPLTKTIHVTYDNKPYVTKMNEFIFNPYAKLSIHKIKEYKAYLAILSILSVNFDITHIKGNQDDHKLRKYLTTKKKLNIDADKIATTCSKLPLNIHLPTAPFAIYIKENIYTCPHTKELEKSDSKIMQNTLYNKIYKWNTLTIHDIDWRLHYIQYNKLPSTGKRNVARFIHQRLPPENMIFENKYHCPFCEMTPDMTTYHYHYLTGAFTNNSKTTPKRFVSPPSS